MDLIIFNSKKTGIASCVKVVLSGCTEIESIYHYEKNKIPIYYYVAHFENGSKLEIENTLYVSDLS